MHAVLLIVFDPAGNLAYTCPNWQFCVLSDPFGIVTAHIDLKWILAYCHDPVENVHVFFFFTLLGIVHTVLSHLEILDTV